jgi:hypothetical protein
LFIFLKIFVIINYKENKKGDNMNTDFRKFLKEHQYEIPHKLIYLAYYYPNVTWKDALEAYCFSVELVLRKFNVETICDSPLDWGAKGI